MDELVEKVKRILESKIPQSKLPDIRNDDGIIGVLVSPVFEGLESMDRQNMIWDALDRNLEPDEKRQIQIIVAATPEEHMGRLATP
jgi:acid stress-induced BolA-like protein IbaG/YrbA